MVHIDFSIYFKGGSYGHANGCLSVELPAGPGASLNLADLTSLPAPPFFSGQVIVESVVKVDGAADVYACADVYVASSDEAQLLGNWLDLLPGLSIWPNELSDR